MFIALSMIREFLLPFTVFVIISKGEVNFKEQTGGGQTREKEKKTQKMEKTKNLYPRDILLPTVC